ncbi:TetR/AcrR family transcriptional regulator [Bacillus sp. SD088]|uniref:TetR/AcrR family transcriptional regulator n=1 Tax=Bacillus sp. SD088 TaxID=2782012 RepID=UPI001A971939|nr:TetR/AcrR family transcriptional regulator [Bacillus sp. SD088]MBO0994410.1 TetR/AcrR family transcriptional regulator [Bacillus sp. SD088]
MPKRYDAQATIENILTVSAELFLEKGFEKTSMRDIAETAGISKGAIYHHFQSKDEIINAVTEKQEEINATLLQNWLAEIETLTGKEKLTVILEKNLESQEAHYLDNLMSFRIKSAEFVVAYMQDCVNKDSLFIANIIKEGIADGSLETDYPDESAEIFLLLINVWCDPAVFQGDAEKLSMRLKFLQHLMKSIGIDVLNDTLLREYLELLQKLYPEEG